MDITLRNHSDESTSHPRWKANFNQGWEGSVSIPPGIAGAADYRVVQYLRITSLLVEQIDEGKSLWGGPNMPLT